MWKLSKINDNKNINLVKAKIYKTEQNSKCGLCGDRDEAINHLISKSSKRVKKEWVNTRLGREGDTSGIVQEIEILPCKQVSKPESTRENEMHKNSWEFCDTNR